MVGCCLMMCMGRGRIVRFGGHRQAMVVRCCRRALRMMVRGRTKCPRCTHCGLERHSKEQDNPYQSTAMTHGNSLTEVAKERPECIDHDISISFQVVVPISVLETGLHRHGRLRGSARYCAIDSLRWPPKIQDLPSAAMNVTMSSRTGASHRSGRLSVAISVT